MPLTTAQNRDTAAQVANRIFDNTVANVAKFNLTDLQAAVTSVDNALDATLNAAVTAVGGTTTVANGMVAVIPAPFSTATAQQKTLLVCYVLLKRAGLI